VKRLFAHTTFGMSSLSRTGALINQGMADGLHIGAQLWVSLDGVPAADEAFGDARPGVQMQADTLMPWLSSGKPVTAIAIGQLWEKGTLDVNDPVARFIPDFAVNGKEKITLRHLLTHTAGIRGTQTGWPEGTWEQIIPSICRMRIEPGWIVGEKAGYHAATSWFVLAEVVQRVTGLSFSKYIDKNVFQTCGMADCHVAMAPETASAYGDQLGTMWNTQATPPAEAGFETPPRRALVSPGAGLRGPIRELGKLYEALLAGNADLLHSTTIAALTARHRTGLLDHTFKTVVDWGLGFIINSWFYGNENLPYSYGPLASRRTFGHSGAQSSTAFADPERKLVVAAVFNGMCGEVRHARRQRDLCATIYEDLGLT
jgi:CubicO group peptidase (beta-lactamase class C family)